MVEKEPLDDPFTFHPLQGLSPKFTNHQLDRDTTTTRFDHESNAYRPPSFLLLVRLSPLLQKLHVSFVIRDS